MVTFPIRILAIGSDQGALTVLAATVSMTLPGAAVMLASTAVHAIALARAEDPDVILLDIALSGADSMALCRQFKADEGLSAIPLIFLTEQQTEASRRKAALDAGAEGFLAMPPDDLALIAQLKVMSRLKAALRRQQMEQARSALIATERTQALQLELAERAQMAESLRTSEERWRTIIKTSPDGIAIASMTGVVEQASDQAWRMYGFAGPEEVVGRNILEFLDPSCHQTALANIQAMLDGHYSGPAEYLVIRRDGTRFYAEINAEVLCDQAGLPAHLLFVERDVTERKQAEAALQQSEARLRTAERVAHVGHYEIELVTGAVHWSAETCRIFGLAPHGAPPTVEGYAQLVHPDDRVQLYQMFARAVDDAEPFDFEYRILHASGATRYVHSLANVMQNGQGQRTMFGILQDITARKGAETALYEREAQVTRQNEVLLHLMRSGALFTADLQSALAAITEASADIIGTARVSVWRYNEDHSIMRCADLYECGKARHSAGETLRSADFPGYWQTHLQGKVIVATDVRTDPRTREIPTPYWDTHAIHSLLDAPIWLHGTVSGVVSFEQVGAPRVWTAEDERFCTTMATLASLCFESAERVHAEMALRASEERYRRMAEDMPALICTFLPDSTLTYVNPAYCEFFQMGPEALLGRRFLDLLPDATAPLAVEQQYLALTPTAPLNISEHAVVIADGATRWVRWIDRAFFDSQGGISHLQSVGLDITERKRAEESLHDSEEQLRSVFTVASVGIVQVDPRDGRLLRYNDKYCEITGYSAAELSGVCFSELTHPDDHARDWEIFAAAARGETPNYSNEMRYVRKDGSVIWVRLNAAFIRDAGGHPIRTVAVCEDITERKEVEVALQESEARYRRLLELAPIGIAVHAEGKIVFANPAAARLLGADSPAQLAGKPVTEIVHPDQWPAVLARIPRMMAGERELYPVEDVYLRLDGTTVNVEVIAAPMPYQGQPAVLVILRDISERKRAEAERAHLLAQVQAQAQQTAQILDSVPQGVLLLDGDGLVLLANPIGMRDLAALANVAVGDRLTRLADLPLADLLASAPTGPWHELRADQRVFEAIARPIRAAQPQLDGDLGAEQWVVVIDDVTYARTVRDQLQQQERLAAVGQLAAGIAHDFNNILAIIALQSSMALQTSDLPPSLGGRLTTIGEQTANAAALIQQILDFSRRAVLERCALDLAPLLREQVNLLARTLPENIQVSLTCEPGEYVVMADPTRIQQLVMNLAVNARDAMPGGGTLRLALVHQRTPPRAGLLGDTWARLTVTDSGTGIDADALSHIFEPFFTTKSRGQGTGLGLAQVYGIVKQHAGEIEVRSVLGQGATFTVYLPAVAEAAPVAALPAAEPPKGDGATVLLVEDNAILLDAMRDVVEMLGYRVVSAQNGMAALAVLEEQTTAVALVLTDLIMPQMGGDALLAAMRTRGLTTPVVILSGHPLEGELDSLKARGLAGWLLKPPDLRELAQLLAQALAHPG